MQRSLTEKPFRLDADEYFQHLCQSYPIRYDYIGITKGKGLFATKALNQGHEIFNERPYVALQHSCNKEFIKGCESCFRVTGTTREQMEELLQAGDDAELFNYPDSVPKHSSTRVSRCECGAVYCCHECKTQAFDEYHRLICPGKNQTDSVLALFLNHCYGTNEIFHLAAIAIAKIMSNFLNSNDLMQATKPVDMFCKLPWWDVVSEAPEDQNVEEYRAIFRELLADTVLLFREAMIEQLERLFDQETATQVLKDCDELLSIEFFGKIVGMFELNNIGMQIPHPLNDLINEKNDLGPFVQQIKEIFISDDENCDQIFPIIDGTALFRLICTMNHSCDPNCTVVYRPDGQATVVALRDIAQDEEICISYIDIDQDFQTRQEELQEYQFTCECLRCQDDARAP